MANYVEADFGMTKFFGNHKCFSGILKMRYQDFLVNEIDLNETVLHLSSLKHDEADDVKQKCVKQESSFDLDLLSPIEREMLLKLQDGTSSESFMLVDAGNDKTKRTKIHQLIRQCYPNCDSETIDVDGEKRIKVFKSNEMTRKRGRQPKEKRLHHHFLLYKENISTMDAVNLIMKKLHLKHSKCFQYAGNKDKRAVTVQLASQTLVTATMPSEFYRKATPQLDYCIEQFPCAQISLIQSAEQIQVGKKSAMTSSLPVNRLIGINSMTSNIRIGNFSTCKNSLQLGQLWGNRFSVALRNIKEVDEAEIGVAVTSFSDVGFINYFGMQRFGTSSVPTHRVGKALLASKWEEAVDLILSAVSSECGSDVIKSWKQEGKASEAYEKLRNKSSFEGFLLKGITHYGPKQLVQALNRIPRPTRLLYLHSYQSYLWNRIVSERLQLFGHKPVPGDLVLLDNSDQSVIDARNEDQDKNNETKRQKLDRLETSNRKKFSNVKLLSQSEVDNYKITDVVLPLPGSMVVYPNNMKDYYVKLLLEDELNLEVFSHKVKDYSLTGAYRKMVVRPVNVQWDVVRYDDIETPLFTTDHQKIIDPSHTSEANNDGRFRALRIHFHLPSSSYATVALRELTKTDMSIPVQSKLGDEHKLQLQAGSHETNKSISNDEEIN